jgi:molecular chaperone HtpG
MAKATANSAEDAQETKEPQAHAFQAEVSKLLDLMVHSVYSERDVFLRELISNAADALDKLRYEAIARPELLAGDGTLKISIEADKQAKTITVADTGIGMTRAELIDNLGTIARSGTQAFMEKAKDGPKESKDDLHLIGQFGVGFYSAFIVAAKVEVLSQKAGEAEAWLWSSSGSGSFTVAPAPSMLKRGTKIVLHLKQDAEEFLDSARLERIVATYSDHIAHPIMLKVDEQTARQINSANALWARPKTAITPEQYKEFFGHVSGDYSDPTLILHYRAEGRNEYTVLLFVPGERPFDLFDPERRGRQKLYVRRVFITDDADLLPAYLRFVRGVIDSEDMPLNISREMLQNNPIVAAIRKAVTNRVLDELKKTADKDAETYATIWNAFGAVIKEGIYEDFERRDDLLSLLRFRTTSSGEALRGLEDYVEAMKENQTAIFYVTAESMDKALASPQLEGFRAKGVEVLLLTDPVDNFWITSVIGFDGKPFKSATQGAADLDAIAGDAQETKEEEADASEIGTLIAVMKQTLGDAVSDVRKSARLRESAVCLVAEAGGLDRNLEKLLAQHRPGDVQRKAPVLEINPTHAMIKALARHAKTDGANPFMEDAARLLLDQAYVLEGEVVADPAAFAQRLSRVLSRGLTA